MNKPATDTRLALLDAARGLLLSRKRFSMGAVAREAGVSRQAVYLHFEDRFALLDAIVQQAMVDGGGSEAMGRISAAATGDEALEALVAALVAITAVHGALDRAVRAVLASDAALAERWVRRKGRWAAIREVVDRLGDEGRLRADTAPDLAASALGALLSTDTTLVLLEAGVGRASVVAMLRRAAAAAILRDHP